MKTLLMTTALLWAGSLTASMANGSAISRWETRMGNLPAVERVHSEERRRYSDGFGGSDLRSALDERK